REKAIMDEKAIYAKGLDVGGIEEKIKIAKELLNKDMPIEEIIKITGLTKEEIEKIDDLTKEERMQRIAELREKAIMDEKAIYAKGLDVGEENNKIKIAKKLLNKDMPIEEIIRITGLTEEKIEKIDDLTKEERKQRVEELKQKAIMDEKAIYAKGLDIGGIEEKRKIAKELLNLGVDVEIIVKSTGLTIEEIEKLKCN
ncbi:MAG: hypothetical protein J6A29_05910, partial [Clostridia bacterium]|nr:hypothetical protein [Clostridia bacterium]